MIIPAFVSLIISTLLLNVGLIPSTVSVTKNQGGEVLGVSEAKAFNENIFASQREDLGRVATAVMKNVEKLPLPELPPEPQNILPENEQKTKISSQEYDIAAENAIVMDTQNGDIIYEKRADRPWAVASITKLVTALVFLDNNPGWDAEYEIQKSDRREGGRIYLFTGDKVKVKDLFYFSLVGSDNTATIALVSSTGKSEGEFVKLMNKKAVELGLKNTRFFDPSGLNNSNISTAREIAIFAKAALENQYINSACKTKKYEFTTAQGQKKAVINTNELLGVFPEKEIDLLGGKTGFVELSGYCLTSKFKYNNKEIISVVLGTESNDARFSVTKNLVKYVFANEK